MHINLSMGEGQANTHLKGVKVLGLFICILSLAPTILLGADPLCQRVMALITGPLEEVQLVRHISGDIANWEIKLRSWKRDRNSKQAATSEKGINQLAKNIAMEILEPYLGGKDVTNADVTVRKLQMAMEDIITETLNNAAFHGNKGDRRKSVHIQLRKKGERYEISVEDRSGRFFDMFASGGLMSGADANAYQGALQGGGLWLMKLSGYQEFWGARAGNGLSDFGMVIKYTPATGPKGKVLGTKVTLSIHPDEALRFRKKTERQKEIMRQRRAG